MSCELGPEAKEIPMLCGYQAVDSFKDLIIRSSGASTMSIDGSFLSPHEVAGQFLLLSFHDAWQWRKPPIKPSGANEVSRRMIVKVCIAWGPTLCLRKMLKDVRSSLQGDRGGVQKCCNFGIPMVTAG